jgi:hypothetical protein
MKLIKFGLPVMLVSFGILLFALVFFSSRPPLLILSDAGFDAFYGSRRTLFQQAGLSLRLFRRVKRVLIAEDANPEATVFAIEEGAAEPWAVLGPSRYRQGLERYARQRPDVRVVLIREDLPPGSSESAPGPESIFIDTRLTSWRAGRCAAILAGGGGGRILVFQDRRDFPVNQNAFLAGLREENGALIPFFLNGSTDYSSWDEVRCVVLGGPGDPYFNQNGEIPVLLFSWMDPSLSPRSVKVSVDDSPWALALEVLRSPAGGSGGDSGGYRNIPGKFVVLRRKGAGGDSGGYRNIPAKFTVLRGRVEDRELGKRLKKIGRLQISVSLP